MIKLIAQYKCKEIPNDKVELLLTPNGNITLVCEDESYSNSAILTKQDALDLGEKLIAQALLGE